MSLLIGMDLLKQITVFYYLCQGLSIDKQRRTDESCSKYAIKHTDWYPPHHSGPDFRLTLHVHNHSFIDHVCIIMDSEESKPGHAVCLPEEHIDFLTVFFPKYVNLIGSVTHPRVPFLLCSICTRIIGLRVIATVDSFDVEMYCTNPLWRHFLRCMNRGNVNAAHRF